MNMKDKKLPLIAGGAAVVVILLLLIFMPSDRSGDQDAEVISKRVKIELPEETDTTALADSTIDGAAAQQTTESAPVVQPSMALAPEAKPAPVQAITAESRPAAVAPVPAPAPIRAKQAVIEEKVTAPKSIDAPKAVKTVKTAAKTVEKKKKTAASKINAGNAWALNIASFPSLSEAQSLAGKLKKGGYNAYIAGFTKDSVKWHRVRVGFFASRSEAENTGKAIQSKFRVDKPWIARPEAAELKAHL